MPKRVLLAWSGGKDSAMAVAALRRDPSVTLAGLLTTITRDYDRVSIHGVRRSILAEQAAALDLPLFEAALPARCSNDEYERAWASTVRHALGIASPIDAIAYGDLFLADVRAYRERQLGALAIEPMFPLWGRPTPVLATEFIDSGFEAYLVCVDTTLLDGSFAGRPFDRQLLTDLPSEVDPCGERGEFHTCVVAGPIFSRAIAVCPGPTVLRDDRFQYCDLELSRRCRSARAGPRGRGSA